MLAEQGNLFIWGKNYPTPTLLKPKVTLASAGQNHIILTTSSKQTFGVGSNKFGQLGLKQPQFYQQPTPIFQGFQITSIHCGAQHTFFITDKNEVYSCGLNIKGQLGHAHFDNVYSAKLVAALLPFGTKNNKSLSTNLTKPPKSPIVQILQKFDLQVKIEDSVEKIFLLGGDQFVINIACGALFTIAITNKGRVFGCGVLGASGGTTLEDQLERTKFKQIAIEDKIQRISAGLSGAAAVSAQGTAYIWGKFGKHVINIPKRIQIQKKGLVASSSKEAVVEVKIGDEFAILLTSKGQIMTFGENIDNQLGVQSYTLPFKDKFSSLESYPLSRSIIVGRNSVYAIEAESNCLYGWGSNRYGQLFPKQSQKGLLKVTNSKIKIQDKQTLVLSSYFALFSTKKSQVNFFQEQQAPVHKQEMIPSAQYKKLLNDYQLLKAVNMALLQKQQPTRKQHREVQTTSKFQINGVTQFRKFNSNTEISWKEIQLQSQINEGGYGVIYRARWREIQVVVKKFKIENGDVSLRDFLSECHAMEAVRHPNIVMFLGAVTTNPHYSLILEYCSRGSLWSYLQNKDNNITWEDRRRLAIQIAQGVLYLHECTPPILHRDLKSLNIFLDASLRIKIGDFGWTKTLEEYMTNKIGTYQWMAPEVIGSKPYTEKADVFSYSIILWEIASREPPYRNINGAKVSQEVLNRELRPTIPPKCPQGFVKLMKKCWESDPAKRPGFRQIIRELEMMKLA